MGYYIDAQGNYYEGDKAIFGDLEVPQRQNPKDVWSNGAWGTDTGKLQAEKDEMLAQARAIREQILNRLSGILLSYVVAGDTSHNSAIETARQGLLNMTKDPRVVASTDGGHTKAAVMAVYGEIAAALAAADPASVSAFNGISL